MAMVTYPLNNVQYNAEDAELYNAVRISGVWSGSAFDADVAGDDTVITIGDGLAWISNTKFSGKVVAQKETKAIDLGSADPSYNRIDVVAIQFNSVENRSDIVVKKGVASSSPEMPQRSTTESLYELYLYSVLRPAGSSVIYKSNITDLRDNREYCGYMQDSVKPGYAPSLMEHNKGDDFRFWVGTKAEYEKQKDSLNDNVFCIIIDENDVADFVVKRGTIGTWNYTKWNSGVLECTGISGYGFSDNPEKLEFGYARSLVIPLPSGLFNAVPKIAVASVDVYGSAGVLLHQSTKDNLRVWLNTAVPYNSIENACSISFHLVGTWK